jgi:hypothetical protein
MTQFNARLLNEPRMRKVAELTDEISEHAQSIVDALADYESAADLSGQERTDAREEAREALHQAWKDMELVSDQLKAEWDSVHAAVES